MACAAPICAAISTSSCSAGTAAATPQRPSTPCSASARASDPPTTATSSDNASILAGRAPATARPPIRLIGAEYRSSSLPDESKPTSPSPKALAHRPARSENRAWNVAGRSTSGVTGSNGVEALSDNSIQLRSRCWDGEPGMPIPKAGSTRPRTPGSCRDGHLGRVRERREGQSVFVHRCGDRLEGTPMRLSCGYPEVPGPALPQSHSCACLARRRSAEAWLHKFERQWSRPEDLLGGAVDWCDRPMWAAGKPASGSTDQVDRRDCGGPHACAGTGRIRMSQVRGGGA